MKTQANLFRYMNSKRMGSSPDFGLLRGVLSALLIEGMAVAIISLVIMLIHWSLPIQSHKWVLAS